MWQKIKGSVDAHLIKPFRDSEAPVKQIALGSVVGWFWGLTPLVGAQMTIVFVFWVIFRFFRIRFSLPIAMALVWVTNPVTMPFFYYSFYLTGVYFFKAIGISSNLISMEFFSSQIEVASNMGTFEGMQHWVRFMIVDLGWPMLIGSFVMNIPVCIGSYPLTIYLVNRYRRRKALAMGMTLAAWEAKYVHSDNLENKIAPPGRQLVREPRKKKQKRIRPPKKRVSAQ